MEGQGAERGVPTRTAATDKGLSFVNQAALGQMFHDCTSVFDVRHAPGQVQALPVHATVAAAATIIEVCHGEAAVRPVLNARVQHRVAGRGRAAMDEHHQRRFFRAGHGRIEVAMSLGPATGVTQRLRAADLIGRQRRPASCKHLNTGVVARNGQYRRGAYG